MQEILIETIRTDGAVQSRVAINAEYVAELAEQIKAGIKLPPVDVYREAAGECWMADGFHRLRAHEAAGSRTIRANVHKGGKDSAVWHSAGANVQHGLRRTNADKRRAVEMAVAIKPDASIEMICKHCGVGEVFAREIKRQGVHRVPPEQRPKTVQGVDGKTYKLSPPPPPPRPAAKTQQAEDEPVTRKDKPVDRRKEPELDELGQDIPDHLTDLYARGGQVGRLLSMISDVRVAVRDGEGDQLFAECNLNAVETALGQAYSDLKATIPYAVCPWCHGKAPMQAGCRGCGGRGLIGRFRYERTVPDDLKVRR